MSEERLSRVRQLFADALARDPADRNAFLRDACGGDEDLRAEIESLLAARGEMGSFLETPAAEGFVRIRPSRLAPGDRVGSYEILGVIGSGGSATVYEASQSSPRRRVALKVMHADLASDAALRRFKDEAEILARLNHAYIAHVYEAGVLESDGCRLPWFALELVESGRNVLDWVEENSLDTRARLELFARLCIAVHHGHQKGIVHRDIKPDNMLVDASGRPKVIDFGIAAITGFGDPAGGRTREIAGTLPYMSPEQCRLIESDVDVRSDVYALGVLLYELLTGRLPHEVTATPLPEAARRIREDAPTPIARLDRSLRGDVERIVDKALARSRQDRYQSAADLGRDVRNFLELRPIAARRHTLAYHARLFARRRTALLLALATLFLVLVGGAVLSSMLGWRAERNRRAAVAARDRERVQSYVANVSAADAALRVYDVAEARRRLDRAAPDLRNWEWHFLRGRLDGSVRTFSSPTSQPFRHLAIHPDGSRLIAPSLDRYRSSSVLMVWDLMTGETVLEHGPVASWIRCPHWSPDGRRLAWGEGGLIVVVTDVNDPDRALRFSTGTEEVGNLAFHPDGETVVTGSESGRVRRWRVSDGKLVEDIADEGVPVGVEYDPAGKRHAICSAWRKEVVIHDVAATGPALRCEGHREGVVSLDFDPTGRWLASGSLDGTIRIWNASTAEERLVLTRDREPVLMVEFGASGDRILSGHLDGTVTVWDATSGVALETLWGHTDRVDSVVWGERDDVVYSASADGTVKGWRLGTTPCIRDLGAHEELVRGLAYSPDGRRLACASFDDTVRIHDPDSGEEIAVLDDHGHDVQAVAWFPDSKSLVSGSMDATVRIWDAETGACRRVCRGHATGVLGVAISPDAGRMASCSTDGTAILWDPATGQRLNVLAHPGWVWAVAFGPGGRELLTAATDGCLRFWSVETGAAVRTIRTGSANLTCAVYSRDGSLIACGGRDGRLEIRDAATGRELASIPAFTDPVTAVAFGPDGTRLLAAGGRAVRLWDVASSQLVLSLRGHPSIVYAVAFHPDGTQIATGGGGWVGEGCTLRLWGRVPGQAWPPGRPRAR